jgi:hypothetical protein
MTNRVLILGIVAAAFLEACADYGDRLDFGKGRVYYKDGVTEETARRLGELLRRRGLRSGEPYFNVKTRRDVQVLRLEGTPCVRFFVVPGQLGPGICAGFENLMKPALEHEVFEDEPIRLQLCDTDENVLREF